MSMITEIVRKIGVMLLIMMLLIPSVTADVVTAQWNQQPQPAVPTDSAISSQSEVAIVAYNNGYVVALDTVVSDTLWSTDVGSSVVEIVVNPEATHVLAYDTTNLVTLLDAESGAVIWDYQSPSAVLDVDMSLSQKCMIVTGTLITVKNLNGTVYTTISNNKQNLATTQPTFKKAVIDHDNRYIVAGMSDNTTQMYKFIDHVSEWDWQLTDYTYRREHQIVGSSESRLENYGINLTVYRENGTTTGDKIYVGSKVQSDFDDFRFVSKLTGQVLQHAKVGSITNGTTFSVKIPILNESQSYDFYVYYGNPSATDASNSAGISYGNDILPVSTGNWMMETNDGWTPTAYTQPGDEGIYDSWVLWPGVTFTLPSSSWKTQGTSSMQMSVHDGIEKTDYGNSHDQYIRDAYVYATQIFPGFSGDDAAYKATMVCDVHMATDRSDYAGYYHESGDVYQIGTTTTSRVTITAGEQSCTHNITDILGTSPASQTYTIQNATLGGLDLGDSITIRTDSGGGVARGPNWEDYAVILYTTAYIDNIRFQRYLTYPPTHSTWGRELEYPIDGYLQDSEPLADTIRFMDMAWIGDKVSVATDTRLYSLTVDTNGIASSTYVEATGTPYDLMAGSDNNYVIEGRGLKALVYQSGTTLVGVQSAGNSMQHVALDEITGTWAIGGADDNHIYVFSKSNTSSWSYVWGTTPPELARTVAFDARGQNFLYAIDSGYVYFYSTQASSGATYPDVYITVHITKNGAPYVGAICDIYHSDSGAGYALISSGQIADSSGKLVVNAFSGGHYRIVVKDAGGTVEGSTDIHVGRTTYDYYLSINTYPDHRDSPSFSATYDEDTTQIIVRYTDPAAITTSARVMIVKMNETVGTKMTVMNRTSFANPNSIEAVYTVGDTNASYYIEVYGERGAYDYYNTKTVTPPERWDITTGIPGVYYINALITWIFIGGLAYAGLRRSIGVTLFLIVIVTVIAGQLGIIAVTAESISLAIVLTFCGYILSRARGGN